ncbi:MAG TPA: hypothetical protein PK156_42485, partial [Polyangium sp.]|nr:hypothetical protein [Polyangium sp.]
IVFPNGAFTEYASLRHFGGRGLPGGFFPLVWPGPRWEVAKRYRLALAFGRRQQWPKAFVQLGRIAHIIADMSIPSHVHRYAHGYDPFEWWVEGNLPKLQGLPIPDVPLPLDPRNAVTQLATVTAKHAPDATNTPVGRLLRRTGLARPVKSREAGAQAKELIPLAIGTLRSILETFVQDTAMTEAADMSDDDVLLETMDALDIPRKGLRNWFAHNRTFCKEHGGQRVYGELMELMDRCDSALNRKEQLDKNPQNTGGEGS